MALARATIAGRGARPGNLLHDLGRNHDDRSSTPEPGRPPV